MTLVWPACGGALPRNSEPAAARSEIACEHCDRAYPCYRGVLDLRAGNWVNSALHGMEGELVNRLADIWPAATVDELIDLYAEFVRLPDELKEAGREWMHGAEQREASTVQYMDFCVRRYAETPLQGRCVLEAGCGSGGAIPHLAERFDHVIGTDPDLPALLIAAKRLTPNKGTFAAAMLEQQVLVPGVGDAVKCTDVIEHVHDPDQAARVMGSVMGPQSVAFVLTPNRWSVSTIEPHVRMWGVNLLPRRLADRYVEWRTGVRYSEQARLLSIRELKHVLRNTGATIRIVPIEDKYLNPTSKRGQRIKTAFTRPPLEWLSTAVRPVQPTLEAVCVRGSDPD